MSPAAIGGSHLRATSVNVFGPVSSTNGEGINGAHAMKGGSRVFPHLDDLVRAKPEIAPGSSIRKLLQAGETAAKQAETYLDFKRPDLALKEYIVASIIAVNYIPQNANYHELQTDRGELHRLYIGLKKRINMHHPKFEEVKEIIKENNAKSGVKPSASKSIAAGVGKEGSEEHQPPTGSGTSGNRAKPPIQPKPEGLHGKSIQTPVSSSENDLAARFARLRSLTSSVATQDPRIRTQQIPNQDNSVAALAKNAASSVRPLGPREMPPTSSKIERPILDMDTAIPTMPRPPDAIYSPARSADTMSTNNPPLLVSRGSSYYNGRRDSTISTSKSARTPLTADDRPSYFSPPEVNNYTLDHHSQPEQNAVSSGPLIPNSTTVSAEQLYEYLKMGSRALSLLLVDIRSRDQFDEGHIMAQCIICIEPISLRDDMSAEDLGERIVLSPEIEQKLYDQKHDFDLVVYYDQSSTTVDVGHSSPNSSYLKHFSKIIYDHAYDHQLKRRPMLLVGGLDAWVDLVGPGALQSSKAGNPFTNTNPKHGRPLGRVSLARASHVKRRDTRSRTLSEAEEAQWDAALSNQVDEADIESADGTVLDEAFYAKTTEDFLRRYPEIPSAKQSMALPSTPRSMMHNQVSAILPPPTRPPPALPRQRSNGISEKTSVASYAMTNGVPRPICEPGLCGLHNINGAVCYMNSVIQALSASPGIRRFLVQYRYPPQHLPPAQKGEPGPPKQLMTRNLCSLLQHMWCGKYNEIVPRMFLRYVHATHASSKHLDSSLAPDLCYGSKRQHDAGEFLQWLLNILLDEHNMRRDRTESGPIDNINPEKNVSRLMACRKIYEEGLQFYDSPLLRMLGVQTLSESTCYYCKFTTRNSEPIANTVQLGIPPGAKQVSLAMLLDELQKETTHSVDCDHCGRTTAKKQDPLKVVRSKYSYLPEYLMIEVKRSQFNALGGASGGFKLDTPVSFPQVLDMSPWTWLNESHRAEDNFAGHVMEEQKPPFIYDCYAVIQHKGSNESGHYWTVVRRIDPHDNWTDEWHEFNDSMVKPGKTFTDTQGKTTTAIFYRRRPNPARPGL
ncbi:ubiquitin-specific protease doa4 [Clarireedia jacksonii]